MPEQDLPGLEVCLSPALLHLYDTSNAVVVIIDIFRATSTITAALDNGAKCVIPVASIEECISLGKNTENSLTAGERDGKVAAGLEYGNSPLEYPRSFVEGKTLVLTTTNGTRLLHMVQNADSIVIGSFLNLTAVCEFLVSQKKKVVLGCAAWKDRFNLEDTLFAGAVVNRLKMDFNINCDSARSASHLHDMSQGRYLEFLKDSSHYRRLAGFGLVNDMEYCTTPDLHPVVPVLKERELVIHS
jgi:2-phosphosulfolactate phosphatase